MGRNHYSVAQREYAHAEFLDARADEAEKMGDRREYARLSALRCQAIRAAYDAERAECAAQAADRLEQRGLWARE